MQHGKKPYGVLKKGDKGVLTLDCGVSEGKHTTSTNGRVKSGGGRGIRTPGTLSGTAVFKTAAIDHSAIPPRRALRSVSATVYPER